MSHRPKSGLPAPGTGADASGGDDEAAWLAADPRPQYRVGLFGLTHKFLRVLEIVIRHARHNPYRFVIASSPGTGEFDIAMVDMTSQGGAEAANWFGRTGEPLPVVRIGRRLDVSRGNDDLIQASFTANLLKALNDAVDHTLRGKGPPGAFSMPGARLEPDETGRARALIVDDSPTVRRQLAVALQQMGLDNDGVGSAREALDALGERTYDLAFVDVVMPEMDGYRLTREIKRTAQLRGLPVIILTTRSSPFDLMRGALAGCDSYLVKPVSLHSLRETVARLLKKQGVGVDSSAH